MKKTILILFLVSILISSCMTISQTSLEGPIFSSDEYSVKSFEKNSKGYLLTFLSVADSVPNGAMVYIMVAKIYPSGSGEGREYKKGTMKYQFGNLNIPEQGRFSIEFGIGIPDGDQLKIRSKVLFENITKDDIENGFSLKAPGIETKSPVTSSSQQGKYNTPGIDLTGVTAKSLLFLDGEDKYQYSGSYGTISYFYNDGSHNYARITFNSRDELVDRKGVNSYMTFSYSSHISEGQIHDINEGAGVYSFNRNQGMMVQAQFLELLDKNLLNENNLIEWEGRIYDLSRLSEYHDLTSEDVLLIAGENSNGNPGITAYSKIWGYLGSSGYYNPTKENSPYTLVFYDHEKKLVREGHTVIIRHAETDGLLEGVEVEVFDLPMGHTDKKGEVTLPILISGELNGRSGTTPMTLSSKNTTLVRTLPRGYKSPLIEAMEEGRTIYYQVVLDEVRYGDARRLATSEEKEINNKIYKGQLASFTTEEQVNLVKEEMVLMAEYIRSSYWIGMDIRSDNVPVWTDTGKPIWDTYHDSFARTKDAKYSAPKMTHGYMTANNWSTMTNTNYRRAGYIIRWDMK